MFNIPPMKGYSEFEHFMWLVRNPKEAEKTVDGWFKSIASRLEKEYGDMEKKKEALKKKVDDLEIQAVQILSDNESLVNSAVAEAKRVSEEAENELIEAHTAKATANTVMEEYEHYVAKEKEKLDKERKQLEEDKLKVNKFDKELQKFNHKLLAEKAEFDKTAAKYHQVFGEE